MKKLFTWLQRNFNKIFELLRKVAIIRTPFSPCNFRSFLSCWHICHPLGFILWCRFKFQLPLVVLTLFECLLIVCVERSNSFSSAISFGVQLGQPYLTIRKPHMASNEALRRQTRIADFQIWLTSLNREFWYPAKIP